MKDISILFPDSIHFHSRNFKSLFDFIDRHKITHTFIKERNDWVSAYGDYSKFKDELFPYYERLKNNTIFELDKLVVNGVNVFQVARDEALTIYLPRRDFRSLLSGVPSNSELLNIMYRVDAELILLNMSAAWSWLEFWSEKLSSLRCHSYACIFSGAQIYNRSLIETLKTHPTTPLVLEHFFTGNEYYLEEKYQPIPNNTDLKYKNAYDATIIEERGFELNRVKIKAINKVFLAKNKNVTQPFGEFIVDSHGKKVISIIGQVVNDFSVICTAKKYLSSIDFYIELIEKLLVNENNFVVFKAHPWERHKNNIKSSLTYNEVVEYVNKLPREKAERVFVTEEFNLSDLIKQSDHVVTLCSQSAIESAFLGIKPIQLGQAFYGEKGFTYDFDDIDSFICELNNSRLRRYLTISEYNNLELFLIKYLEKSLVSIHKSGILSIERKLKKPSYISLSKTKDLSSNNKSITPKVTIPEAVTPKSVVQETIITKKVVIPELIVTTTKHRLVRQRFNKLMRDPKRFFIDSRHKLLNAVGKAVFR